MGEGISSKLHPKKNKKSSFFSWNSIKQEIILCQFHSHLSEEKIQPASLFSQNV